MNATYRQMTGPEGLLASRTEFRGNSVRAARITDGMPGPGLLDVFEEERLRRDWETAKCNGLPLYTVFSYKTPIAWAIGDGAAYCVEQRFSVTTSKSQTYVRAWINRAQEKSSDQLAS